MNFPKQDRFKGVNHFCRNYIIRWTVSYGYNTVGISILGYYCHHRHTGSKTLLQQQPPVLNWWCWLTRLTCIMAVIWLHCMYVDISVGTGLWHCWNAFWFHVFPPTVNLQSSVYLLHLQICCALRRPAVVLYVNEWSATSTEFWSAVLVSLLCWTI